MFANKRETDRHATARRSERLDSVIFAAKLVERLKRGDDFLAKWLLLSATIAKFRKMSMRFYSKIYGVKPAWPPPPSPHP